MTDQDAPLLDADRLQELFGELSSRLSAASIHAQLFVVGGAAMALAYDSGRMTRDVDALFEPAASVRAIAASVGADFGLEPDWLNDAAKGYLPGGDSSPTTVFESDSLVVQVPSPPYLLAMKLLAARGSRDLEDAATLYNRLGLSGERAALEILESSYPSALLLPKHHHIVSDVVRRAAAQRGSQPPDEGH